MLLFLCVVSVAQSAIDAHSKSGDPYVKGETISVNGIVGQVDFLEDDLDDEFAIVEIEWSTGHRARLMRREYIFAGHPFRFGPLASSIVATDADQITATVRLIAVDVLNPGGDDPVEQWTLLDEIDVVFKKRKRRTIKEQQNDRSKIYAAN